MSRARDIVHPAYLQDVKAGTADLLRSYGSQQSAEALTGVRQQKLSDCGNANTGDFLALDTVVELERRTVGTPGWPQVTRTLARLHGCALIRLPEARDAEGAWLDRLSQLSGETSDIISGICSALADGTISAAEAKALRVEVGEGQQLLADVDAALAAIEGGKA